MTTLTWLVILNLAKAGILITSDLVPLCEVISSAVPGFFHHTHCVSLHHCVHKKLLFWKPPQAAHQINSPAIQTLGYRKDVYAPAITQVECGTY
jgi:hypothetical protein